MSLVLARIGRCAHQHPWRFIVPWLIVLGVVIGLLRVNGTGDISANVTIDGTQSEAVLNELRAELPAASGGQGTIVFTAPAGSRLDAGARADAVTKAARDIEALPVVVRRDQAATGSQSAGGAAAPESPPGGMAPPGARAPATGGASGGAHPLMADGKPVPGVLVSGDGSTAMLQIQFTQQVDDLSDATLNSVVDLARAATSDTDVSVLVSESLKPMNPPVGGHEVIGLGVAALVLILTLGSLLAAGLPILTALLGVAIGLGGAMAISHSIPLTKATPVLALMVGLAVGIDYALFIVNRQRQLMLADGMSAREASGLALGTAGSAVLFAGATVITALAALSVIGISFLTTMALVAAATVLFAVLIALTLLPALLGLIGERIVTRRSREKQARAQARGRRSIASRWIRLVVRRPWAIVAAVVVVLGLAAVPALDLSLGMPSGSTANSDTSERQSYDAITRAFGEGHNGPLIVVARPGRGGTLDRGSVGALTTQLEAMPDVAEVGLMGAKPDGSIAILQVIPEKGPLDATTTALVDDLRAATPSTPGAREVSLGVTGITAVNIDISEKLSGVLPAYVAIIVGISLILLLFVFRSVLIPIKATVGFLLSILATFGITTAVFQWGWLSGLFGFDTTGPLVSFLPIMVTGILYGLAMDYEVFLVTSMRHAHVHGEEARPAIITGFERASRVVVAAAVIMVSVFAAFIFTGDPTIKQLGLALAMGILIDAFLVRMTLGPAVMAILDRRAWWLPRALGRVLPDLDIEGERLATTDEADLECGRGRRRRRDGGVSGGAPRASL